MTSRAISSKGNLVQGTRIKLDIFMVGSDVAIDHMPHRSDHTNVG